MQINIAKNISEEELNNFLSTNEHKIFHIYNYKKFIEDAFGGEYQFIVARDKNNNENNNIITILPIVKIKSRIFGSKLISSSYIEYGGFSGSTVGILPILDYLKENNSSDCDYLEIRGGMEEHDPELSKHLIKKNLYKRFVLKLKCSSENFDNKNIKTSRFNNITFSSGSVPAVIFFRSNIQKSKRKAINKAVNNNIKVKDIDFSEKDEFEEFYNLYCKNMRNFGSPSYSKSYFISFYKNLVLNKFGKIYGAYDNEKLVAALLGFCYNDSVHIIISVSDEKKQENRPNDAVHSEFIEWAIENNYKYFDFGRVREESGQFEYKQKWSPELLDLPSYFALWNIKDIPFVDPQKHQFLVKAWRRLPLFATKALGMKIRKELGI